MLDLIKERIAPCGLHCGKCFAFHKSEIRELSTNLRKELGDFDVFAQRFVDLLNEPVFKKYSEFKELLNYFSSVECRGCREGNCKLFKDCEVRACFKEKEVDFCYQCNDFPCNNTGFDEHLYKRFVEINLRIKTIGIEKYYTEVKDKARYSK
jgi:hypothetical protein